MTISLNIHDPDRAEAQVFMNKGRLFGAVHFYCGEQRASLYTTPEKARAIAAIMADDTARIAEAAK